MNRPVTLLVKPASSGCNLRCGYCFYADVAASRSIYRYGPMTEATSENLVRGAFEGGPSGASFVFQGGEPMLAGLDFYRGFLSLVERYRPPSATVSYAIQTNGTLIDDESAAFFAEKKFLVGVSLDGKADVHDAARKAADGSGTFRRVTEGIRALKRHGADFNILSVVTKRNYKRIRETYSYFKSQGYRYLQFIPCIGGDNEMSEEEMGRFLCALFQEWYEDLLRGRYVSIRTFDNYVAILRGLPPENCGMCGVCGNYYAVESDGSVYPCDFYCTDKWRLGNVNDGPLSACDNALSKAFVEESKALPAACAACPYVALCRNGCKNDRIEGKNKYCNAYRDFFRTEGERLRRAARLAP